MTQAMTRYFRSALVVRKQKLIKFKSENFQKISTADFESGRVPVELFTYLKKDFCRTHNLSEKTAHITSIDIILIAKTVKSVFKDKEKYDDNIDELTGIYYIPAVLYENGRIGSNSDENKWPWIPREFLSPMIDPLISVGETGKIDSFFENTTNERYKINSWKLYIEYAKSLYEAITSTLYTQTFILSNGESLDFDTNIYIIPDNTVFATFHIEQLYDHLISDKEEKKLYSRFMNRNIEKSISLIPESNPESLAKHSGQMAGEYPSSVSQRDVIHHFKELDDGEILAVKGPPGTGKTTLLQAIVADMYVRCALEKKLPPVIIASSTNNQAVTNIIDSFTHINSAGISNLEKRWITGVNGFGSYFPSSSKKDIEKYQVTSCAADGFAEAIDTEDNLTASRNVMLENVKTYFRNEPENIQECKEKIHSELCLIEKLRIDLLKSFQSMRDMTAGRPFSVYLADIDVAITSCSNIIETGENHIRELEKNSELYRERVENWKKKYRELSFFIKNFSFIPSVRKEANNYLSLYITPDEQTFLPHNFTLASIIQKYSEKIREINQKITDQKISIIQTENKKQVFEEQRGKLLTADVQCRRLFMGLIQHNPATKNSGDEKNNKAISDKTEKIFTNYDIVLLNEFLDTNIRYIEFWLAVHYYECRWVEKENILTEKQRGKNYKNVIEKFYHRLALVTPCMVMTFFMLPKQFQLYNYNTAVKSYLYNFIDLLIIDEAGQAAPEVAAASFSLAKKALVVGDEYQIPPVYEISAALDMALAKANGVITDIAEYDDLKKTGHNCSESNVMRIASNACKYEKHGKGLFLSEHRRCYDEIITFCNELVYDNNLQPCRGQGKTDTKYPLCKLPFMGYKNIPVSKSDRQGESRINTEEAEEIVNWIFKNYKKIVSAYRQSYPDITEDELFGIITPFKSQVSVLKSKMREELSIEYRQHIEIGTIHTFQGAERRIIILSSVYGEHDACAFINRDKSLLNVAVSRAKDAFWIFGSRQCLDTKGNSPSALLYKYTENNEIH